MKICLITSIFNTWESGGVAIYVRRLVKELAKKHEVFVISSVNPKSENHNKSFSSPDLIEIDNETTIRVYNLLSSSSLLADRIERLLWLSLRGWNFLAYRKIMKILNKEKPDIIHTNTIKGFSPSVFSTIKNLQIPHVHTLHDYELISPWWNLFRNGKPISNFNFLERIYIQYNRRISSSIQVVIAPSHFVMDFHIKHGYFRNSKQYIVPHGFDIKKRINHKKKMTKEFLYLGGLTNYKGPHIVVSAFKKLKDKDARLHIVGKGPYLKTLRAMRDKDKRIVFHGFLKEGEADHIYEKCSYFIFPSICYETFGMTIIEAMSKGLPVIGSNIGATPELIKDSHNGFLFESGNVDELYSILKNLLYDETKLSYLSKNAVEELSEKLSLNTHVKKIIDIYTNLLQ